MPRQIAATLLLLFLAVIGVNSPELPYNARLVDVIFIPLAIAVLTLPGAKWTWRWTDLAVAGYLLGAVPSILVSSDRQHSLIELGRELYLAAIYVIAAIATRQGFARTIGKGLALGTAVLSTTGLIFIVLQLSGALPPVPGMGEFMRLPYIGDTLRLRAHTATPAMFACLLTVAVPFAIAFCRERIRAWCASSIAMMVAAFFTFSHVLAGLAAAVLIASWPSLASWPRLRRVAIAGIVALVVAFNFAATISITSFAYGDVGFADSTQYQYAVGEGRAQIGGASIAYNVMSYARIKEVALHAFTEHPITGVGLDRFHTETALAYAKGLLPPSYREIDPHSTLLGRFAECGLFGGITLLLLWAAWAVMARDVARSGVEPLLIGECPSDPRAHPDGHLSPAYTLAEYLNLARDGGYLGAWPWSFKGVDAFGSPAL